MKITVHQNCSVGGESIAARKKPYDFPDNIARQLISAGRARTIGPDLGAKTLRNPNPPEQVDEGTDDADNGKGDADPEVAE